MWHSEAVTQASNALRSYGEDLQLRSQVPAAAALLDQLHSSVQALGLTEALFRVRQAVGPPAFDSMMSGLLEESIAREYLAVEIADDALLRAEEGVQRLSVLAGIIAATDPPARSAKFLSHASDAYLLGLDYPCIAMCRAAVEVLVEEFAAPDVIKERLGKEISRLRDRGSSRGQSLSQGQAEAMHFINDQAKEVLHDEPASHRLDARQCLERLCYLVSTLHPAPDPSMP